MYYFRPRRKQSKANSVLVGILFGVFFFFLCCPLALAAEPPVPPSAEWSTLFRGRPGDDPCAAYSVVLADEEAPFGSEDHYIVTGDQVLDIPDPYHPPSGIGHWTILAKLNLGGTIVDSEIYNTEDDHNAAYALIPSYSAPGTIDGYVITGYRYVHFSENSHNFYTPWTWLKKVTTSFDPVWEHTWKPPLESPFSDWGNSVVQDGYGNEEDSGFIIGGQKSIDTLSSYEGYLIRADNSGNLDWAIDGYMFDGGGSLYPWLAETHSIIRNTDGDYILGTSSGIVKVNAVNGAPPTHAWTYGGASYKSVKQTADSGYIGVGKVLVSPPGGEDRYDVILTKLDADGGEMWSRTFGRLTAGLKASGLDDYGNDVIQTSVGGYALIGTTRSYAWHGGSDMWLIKTDDDGVMEWDLVLGNDGYDAGHSLVEAPDHGLVLAGNMAWEGTMRMWVLKIRPGDFTPPVPSFSTTPASPFHVEENIRFDASASTDPPEPGGGIVSYEWDFGDSHTGSGVIDHHIYSQPTSHTATLYVTDNEGVRRDISRVLTANTLMIQWERHYGQGGDYGRDMVATPDGGFVIAGTWMVTIHNNDFWVFKTDGRGNVVWDKKHDNKLSPSLVASASAVTCAHDGGYVLAGSSQKVVDNPQTSNIGSDIWLLKVDDAAGDEVWESYFDLNVTEQVNDIAPVPAPENGYIMTGYTGSDLWLIKTRYDDTAGVEKEVMDWDSVIPGLNPDNQTLEGYSVIPTADGGYVTTGVLSIIPSYPFVLRPILTVKTDSTGTVLWRASGAQGDRRVEGRWVCQTPDQGYMVVARLDFASALQKLSPTLGQQSLTTWGGDTTTPRPVSAAITPDWGFAVLGRFYYDYSVDRNWDIFISRTDSEGELSWEWYYRVVGETEEARQILRLSDGSFVVLANRPDQSQSTWLLKLGPNNPPTGDFTYMPDPPREGSPVEFTATAGDPDPDGYIETYEWQFGDNEEASVDVATIHHTYLDQGDYTVILTIVDNSGGERVVSHDITVEPAGALPGDLDADDDVDGMDLAGLSEDLGQLDLVILAEDFGRIRFP